MITKASPLPCIEPTRCFVSSKANDLKLSSSPNGVVSLSTNRESCEEWTLTVNEDRSVCLLSTKHGHRLGCGPDGDIFTATKDGEEDEKRKEGWDRWRFESCKSGVMLVSVAHEKMLGCDDQKCVYSFHGEGDAEDWMVWTIDFASGELLFLSSSAHNVRVLCNPFGKLSLSKAFGGWEVWRFIESGDGMGSVYMESWTHRKKFLSLSEDGEVKINTTAQRTDADKWTVVKAPEAEGENIGEGVIIRSVATGKMLGTDGTKLHTNDDISASEVWHLDSANRGTFFLTNLSMDCRAGSRPETGKPPFGTFTTKNRKSWEGWLVQEAEDGSVTMKSDAHGRYLATDESGSVVMNPDAKEGGVWWAEPSQHKDGKGLVLVSDVTKRLLSCTKDGHLTTTLADSSDDAIEWHLEPCLPGSLTGPQLGALCAAGVVTLVCAAAMPFAVMGTLTAAGFTSEGIAAGSAAAGMMSAEAATSGAIAAGGVVATCQSIGAAGLGAAGLSAAIGGGAILGGSISAAAVTGSGVLSADESVSEGTCTEGSDPIIKRPFCAWRSW